MPGTIKFTLYYYGTEYAECNAHILRYLKKNTEETGNAWSGEFASLLREIHRERKTYIKTGETICCLWNASKYRLITISQKEI